MLKHYGVYINELGVSIQGPALLATPSSRPPGPSPRPLWGEGPGRGEYTYLSKPYPGSAFYTRREDGWVTGFVFLSHLIRKQPKRVMCLRFLMVILHTHLSPFGRSTPYSYLIGIRTAYTVAKKKSIINQNLDNLLIIKL